ncbi:Unknown protein [Striga hermonthica]|uniref:MtN19-like protein n=1 Tax=Striga hermonthica TaxID=68872 RepID=A0A9N7NB80_STRHE|nr:Unknown protein [Striga hermonthica]
MVHGSKHSLHYTAFLLLLFTLQGSRSVRQSKNGLQTEVFLSPKFMLQPGSVSNKFYYNIDFPRGHIALKSFDAEVVDEKGNSIPLHETYLHHWLVVRYIQRKGAIQNPENPDYVIVKNDGLCNHGLIQYFGLGSETRKTDTHVPDPYGIEMGNPALVPEGYEELWMLNVHAIDTRGAEDAPGCTECRCDLYNLTVEGYGGHPYKGGLRCCGDGKRCRVKEGFEDVQRSLYLRYKVTYVDWDASILPVKIYIIDVTDLWTREDGDHREKHRCLIEYDVESCPVGVANDRCTHTTTVKVSLPTGGDVIYGVGHQHKGGIGSTLYGEGGREICSSVPTYGTGDGPGNEDGYIVGMSTCYPKPGSVKISAGEFLTLVSNYSSKEAHTGVMGLFYLLIHEPSAEPNAVLHSPAKAQDNIGYGIARFVIVWFFICVLLRKSGRGEGY